jgi:hypothetical protein
MISFIHWKLLISIEVDRPHGENNDSNLPKWLPQSSICLRIKEQRYFMTLGKKAENQQKSDKRNHG